MRQLDIGRRLDQCFQTSAGLAHPFSWLGVAERGDVVETFQLAEHPQAMPAGERVVTSVGDAIGGEVRGADRQAAVPRHLGHHE